MRYREWDDIPLYTRLYLADKFFNFDIRGQNFTAIPDINIKNKTKNIKAIEEKYEDALYDDISFEPDIKELKNVYKGCIVSIEEGTSMESLWNVCFTSFMNMVKTETFIKKCANCGKYFIYNRVVKLDCI